MTLDTNASNDSLNFLIDSQADISIIKQSFITNQLAIDYNSQIYIKGITDEHINSIGTTNIIIYFENTCLSHILHVVPDDFAIPVCGILGKDFLKNFNCTLEYSTMTLTIQVNECSITIDIWEGPEENTIVIPPRSEVIRHFKVHKSTSLSEDQFIDPSEVIPGVMIARSIFDPKSPYIRVINTTDKFQVIPNQLPKSERLSNYDIISLTDINKNDKARLNELANIVGKEVPKYVQKDLVNLCKQYSDVFAMEQDKYSVNNFYKQKLRIKDDTPVYVKQYRLPKSHKKEINAQVKTLLENDLIEPSCSDFNSPLLLVPKPELNGKKRWRMCVDYRLVNKKLVADKYPLPRIDEILDNLGRAKYFSIIDLFNGFHQIPLDESSRDITSFSTSDGCFRWKVLPFGLNVSPNSFSRMMSLAFAGASQIQFFLYLDDIIVIGKSIADHLNNLEEVFKICRYRNLKLHPHKCKFFRSEVTYLGHRCTNEGISPDPNKIHCVRNYPVPNDKDSTKRFVAFANYYRRFIENFSAIAHPLNRLTRKNIPFHWTNECQAAFEKLKSCLISPPVLAYPDFSLPFIITTDASKYACGAVLSQNINGENRPIAFASKTFTKGECNKITMEQELLAIHWAIKYFRPYIYDTFFTVNSDHRSLVYLFSLKDPSSKLTRIRLDLEEHNFEIVHIKGKSNVVADALSRIHIDELKSVRKFTAQVFAVTRSQTRKQKTDTIQDIQFNQESQEITKPKVYEQLEGSHKNNIKMWVTEIRQLNHNFINILDKKRLITEIDVSPDSKAGRSLETILAHVQKAVAIYNINELGIHKDDILFKYFKINEVKETAEKILRDLTIIIMNKPQHIADPVQQKHLIETFHNDMIFGGHPGQKRLYSKLRKMYYWKNMAKQVAKFVKNCDKCLLNKVRIGNKEPLALTSTPQKPFDVIVIDTIGKLPMSESGNLYALTIICDLTKYVVTAAMPNKEAKTVARALMNNFILVYGVPKTILSDLGTEFKNEVMRELATLLKINHLFSTPHHHETVGSIERNHRTFNEYLRMYLPEMTATWDEFLKYFVFTYNTTPNISLNLKYSPYELIFSKYPTLFDITSTGQIDPVYNIDNFAKEAKFRLQLAHVHSQNLLQKSKLRNKVYYDAKVNPIDLQIGDKVIITNDGRTKFEPIHKGPFVITDVDTHNATIKNLATDKTKIVHKNRLRKIN